MLDRYTIERMDRLCIEMLESIAGSNESSAAVAATIAKLQEMRQRGEEWAKHPHIPFSMGSMDERNLDERIVDNTKVIRDINRRIDALRLWSD